MPVVLSQHPFNDRYQDVEGVIYNFPSAYFEEVEPFERFLYYRPSKGATKREASTYIGHGRLGTIYPTPWDERLRTVEISAVQYFRHPVSYKGADEVLFETRFDSGAAFQGRAVRRIGDLDFHRILAAANVSERELSTLVPAEAMLIDEVLPRRNSPLRAVSAVPAGTGYVPSNQERPDPAETAALQERARAGHQRAVQTLIAGAVRIGGSCFMNNNIDLLIRAGEQTMLFEAKSLLDARMAVDRMRYAIGQLADYGRRYREILGENIPAVAFANPLGREREFVGDVLQSKGIGLVLTSDDQLCPGNEAARSLRLFTA